VTTATKIMRGVVHGKTVELEHDTGLPDGQQVTVTMQTQDEAKLPPGEGLRRSFGGWAEDAAELDEFLKQVRRDRNDSRPEPGA
jgi:hypothetical protein